MHKFARYLGIGLLALLAVLLVGIVYIVLTFDPNAYKPRIIELVQERTGRTLAIPGDIELSFYPDLGVELGKLSLSERNSSETFASVESARVALELLPLLSRELVVDEVQVTGLRAVVRRNEQGAANFDDLLGGEQEQQEQQEQQQETGGEPIAFDIGSVVVRDSHLLYEDLQQGRRIEVSDLDLESDGITEGEPSRLKLGAHVKSTEPALDVQVAAHTVLTLDLKAGRYQMQDLDLALRGAFAGIEKGTLRLAGDADLQPADRRFALADATLSMTGDRAGEPFELQLSTPRLAVTDNSVEGAKLAGEVKLSQAARRIIATFQVPSFTGTPQAFRLPTIEAKASVSGPELDLQAQLTGALSGNIDQMLFESPQLVLAVSGTKGGAPVKGSVRTPVSLDLEQGTLALPKLAADFTLPSPASGTVAVKAQGQVNAQLEAETVSAKLEGKLDQSAFNAQLGMTGFSDPAYRFDIGLDRLDFDRYRKPASAAPAAAPASPQAGKEQERAAEEPIDLSFLRDLKARGSVRVGELRAAGLSLGKLRADLRAESGTLQVEPLSASLYGGTLAGSASVQAADVPRIALRQKLAGVNVGPLLKDGFEQDILTGRGDVQLDITMAGATVDAMLRALDGTARVALRDGVIRGFNIAQILRNARSRIDALRGKESAATGTATQTESTDFSAFSGSFRIEDGVARNDDLDVKTPLLRIGGSGAVNLPEKRLDYVARTTVVASLKGQGGPELEKLKGVTLPVHLSGPFDSIDWKVDVAALATELAREKLGGKAEEAKARVKESLEEEKAKIKDELQERLRGLFN